MWVLGPHVNIAKEEENPMCALNPHVGIAIEEEKFNMCFDVLPSPLLNPKRVQVTQTAEL